MNAVLKPRHIETIFDYDLTDDEFTVLAGGQSKDEYISTTDQETKNKGLMFLFAMRNDDKSADIYMNRLDTDYVQKNVKWDSVHSMQD